MMITMSNFSCFYEDVINGIINGIAVWGLMNEMTMYVLKTVNNTSILQEFSKAYLFLHIKAVLQFLIASIVTIQVQCIEKTKVF